MRRLHYDGCGSGSDGFFFRAIPASTKGKMAIRINVGQPGCNRSVLKQCGLILKQCGPVTERCYRVRTVYILGPLHLGACPEPIAPWIQIWLQNLLLVISCLQLVIYTSITPPFHGGNTGSNPLGSLSALRRANQLQQRIHSLSQSASIK